MSTAHVEVWLRNSECNLLQDCWRADLVVQSCAGKPLVDTYPEIIDQLKEKYGKPASAKCTADFPLTTDQGGNTLEITVGSGATETLTFSTTIPSQSLVDIYAQMKAFFQKVKVSLDDGIITVTSIEHGPDATMTIGGTSSAVLTWGPITNGYGYTIKSHYYQNAWRIMLYPGGGETLNHIDLEIPPCAYKIWCRVCHGQNEETSMVFQKFQGSKCYGVDLLLPTIKTCAANNVHPAIDKVVYEEFLADDAERVAMLRGLLYVAGIGKQLFQDQLAYRWDEADEKGDADLKDRVEAVQNIAQLLPDCY